MAESGLPVLRAQPSGAGGPPVEVLAFSAGHARALLGPHLHADLELMLYAEGEGVDRLGEVSFDVAAGDLLLVTPGIVHDASGLGTARGWALEFSAGAVDLWWSNPLLAPFVSAGQAARYARFQVPQEQRPRWIRRLADMEREQAEQADGWVDVMAALLQVTLVELARLAAPFPAGLRQQGEGLLAEVFEVIEQRFREPLSTADLARAVGLTPGYLTTLVRRRTGRTVLDWILERRMQEARRLLLGSDLSAEAIAQRVGFRDPAYFNRRFRAAHGVAPGRWRTAALATPTAGTPGERGPASPG